ncbi:hypothetical protein AbraIFM66950_010849 [Aspergillus brasiliensis]|nr:hypothetical protein AbraIFM66950_010849 [Aspergillus brasiliensis]
MSNQSLLQYLSVALPAIPIQGAAPSRNTTNPRYGAGDISQVVDWPEFNYATIIQRYGGILNSKQIVSDPFRRALRAGFEELAPRLQQLNLVPITFDGGGSAAYVDQFRPDTAFVVVGGTYADSTNRAPGDMKNAFFQEQYKQVLAQVNFYMGQHKARHGFVLTNTELVAIKRIDTNGRLAVSSAIPWTAGGHGQLTVLMGIWYLGMLAAEGTNWTL